MPLPSIADVAAKAVESPKDCTETDVMRLGLWFLDHPEHVRRHAELSAPQREYRLGERRSIVERLAADRPQPLQPGLPDAAPAALERLQGTTDEPAAEASHDATLE